jgi:hypothetical protein
MHNDEIEHNLPIICGDSYGNAPLLPNEYWRPFGKIPNSIGDLVGIAYRATKMCW